MKSINLTVLTFLSILSIVTITTLLNSLYAQENLIDADSPKFLAIQHAQSGSISKINDTAYTLELKNISKKTILFSDRPDRIVTFISTSDFIGNWSAGLDSFAKDAPNAVLVVDDLEVQDTTVLELYNPTFDSDKKKLKYEITPDNATSTSLPKEVGQTTLIIDAALPSFGGGGLGL